MNKYRKFEYFSQNKVQIKKSISNCPPKFFKQERDWTCAFACIRTIMSSYIPDWLSEENIINKYQLTAKPYFSYDIKKIGILNNMNIIYGCDHSAITFEKIIEYMDCGYYIMLESMINYSHWMVLIGCYVLGNDSNPESVKLSFFDPYYNDVKIILLDEFINMWIDVNNKENHIEKDFIAIKS